MPTSISRNREISESSGTDVHFLQFFHTGNALVINKLIVELSPNCFFLLLSNLLFYMWPFFCRTDLHFAQTAAFNVALFQSLDSQMSGYFPGL